jgi:catechol 2,3-dioxygenase-like lactoylglutathione lyase family enzyme
MAAPFGILGIDHVVLRAADPDALERFYVDVLGCALDRRQERIRLTQLRAGRSLIDIVPADGDPPGDRGRNVEHLCLRVEPFDADAIRAHLAAHGVGCEPPARRYGADGEGPSIYLADPEGNRVELKGPPEG